MLKLLVVIGYCTSTFYVGMVAGAEVASSDWLLYFNILCRHGYRLLKMLVVIGYCRSTFHVGVVTGAEVASSDWSL